MRGNVWWLLFALPLIGLVGSAKETEVPALVVSELVTDPQSDWNGDDRITGSDEFVELHNAADVDVDVAGWRLILNDTTPATHDLVGIVPARGFLAIMNPVGDLNNNGHVLLVAPDGSVVDDVRFGSWTGNVAGVPDGNANHVLDEALLLRNGSWEKGHATPDEAPGEPRIHHVPPFVAQGQEWFDPGNVTRNVSLTWTDSDTLYASAELAIMDDVAAAPAQRLLVGPSGGVWRADWTLVTPNASFDYRIHLVSTQGERDKAVNVSVNVDRDAPEPPVVEVPRWTNRTDPEFTIPTPLDAGVGGVEVRVDRWNVTSLTWEPATAWSPDARGRLGNVTSGMSVRVRALARDAFENEAPGPEATTTLDAQPPSPPSGLVGSGYDVLSLSWSTPTDEGSGVAAVHVERDSPGGARAWNLEGAATHIEDSTFRLGEELTYTVFLVDAAGNVGPASILSPPYEGRRPHVEALRANHIVWGPGTLRVHADFDRAMDTSLEPRFVLILSGTPHELEGRWLANRSTYLVELSDADEFPEGEGRIDVSWALDARGESLWASRSRVLRIDREPPTLIASDVEGWVGKAGLLLVAEDSGGSFATLRYRVGANATTWLESPSPLMLDLEGPTRVEAYAVDVAGHRSATMNRMIRPDAEPPRLEAPAEGLVAHEAFALRLDDGGSGLEPPIVVTSTGDAVPTQWDEAKGRLTFTVPDGAFTITLRDRVGNVADHRFVGHVPPPPSPPTLALDDGAAPLGARDEEQAVRAAAPPIQAPREGFSLAPWAIVAVIAFGAALFFPTRRILRRRPKPGPGSLASRILAHRAAAPPTQPLEESMPCGPAETPS